MIWRVPLFQLKVSSVNLFLKSTPSLQDVIDKNLECLSTLVNKNIRQAHRLAELAAIG